MFKIKEEKQKLSKESGISRTTIVELESGRISVTKTDTLIKIALALGKKVSDVFLN
ncbi:MAG: helix-turn-helix domain-containing protein [Culicoidibacterales bacterium]